MTSPNLKEKITKVITQSIEINRVCHISIPGTGQFRVDGNYIILIKEDGTYHRINKQQLDWSTLELIN